MSVRELPGPEFVMLTLALFIIIVGISLLLVRR